MKREEARKYQQAQISILDYVVGLCEQLHVTYYLGFGTLLGAIRHKGFIPWDPDVDIMMFRTDYEKFCSYCEEHNEGCIFIDTFRTDKYHISPHAIVRIPETHVILKNRVKRRFVSKNDGIYIDVFPIDNVPDDVKAEKKQIEDIKRIERLVTLKQAPIYKGKTGGVKKISKLLVSNLLCLYPFNSIIAKRDAVMQRHNNVQTKQVAAFLDPTKWNPKAFQYHREWFDVPAQVEFEGKLYNAPCNYDAFLARRYGDYMKLPPEDQRWVYFDNALDYIDYGPYGDREIVLK